MNEGVKRYRYYDFIMAAFVTILILSNLVAAAKAATLDLPIIGAVTFGAGILFFPISYIIGDVLTEVYGYARARRVVWAGFAAMIFMAVSTQIIVAMPPAERWHDQAHYEAIFGQTPRIVMASIIAFWAGEFANAYVMAKMKLWTKGKHLWSRTIGSTFVGQGVDSLIFYPVAFWGLWDQDVLVSVAIFAWLTKVVWEALLTPVTYKAVAWLKTREHEDVFDTDTDFTPFKIGLKK